jgi:hypothetical protein
MATKSILKNIDIKDKKMARLIISALEYSKDKRSKNVVLRRTCQELKGGNIKDLFGDK